MINVTKTFMPPLEDYVAYLEQLWATGWITNNGVLVQELTQKLKAYLGAKHLLFLSNGTVALQIAIKALELQGEIITTPFSYVATTSTIVWENCTPVFADIDPETFCIDPKEIEKAITPRTVGIMATHVYGNACDVEAIERIAKKHNLKVIYDGAHAFGASFKGRALATYGDLTTLSFHATKVFHSVEGGAIVTNDDELAHKVDYMHRFGHNGPLDFWGVGINGKNSEFHAAMGLCVLKHIDAIIAKRKKVVDLYDKLLQDAPTIRPKLAQHLAYNYAYYPVLFENETILLHVYQILLKYGVKTRRYFNPSLNTLNYVNPVSMPVSENVASRVLCLPLSTYLTAEEQERITAVIIKTCSGLC